MTYHSGGVVPPGTLMGDQNLISGFVDPCPYCRSTGDCEPECPMTACGECGNKGMVIDFDQPVPRDVALLADDGALGYYGEKSGERWYFTKPCPRGCRPPSHDTRP